MARARLGGAVAALICCAAANCGGNTSEGGGNQTGGSGNDSGSGGNAAIGGRAGTAGSNTVGQAGVGGAGAAGSGGSAGTSGQAGSAGTAACTFATECVVRPRSCCGDCGAASRGDAIALPRSAVEHYSLEVCANKGCPACYLPQDPTLLPRCENAACTFVDLLALPLTACRLDSDCRMRTASCCECGGNVSPDALIAIRRDSELDFQRLVCNGVSDCDGCLPPYPEMAKAACFMGRCTVTGTAGTTPPPPI